MRLSMRKLSRGVPLGLAALAASLALVAACEGEADVAPAPPPAASPEATAVPTAVPILDGETLFRQTCAVCHGIDLQGTAQGPPFIDRLYHPNHHSDAAFRLAVQRGVIAHHWPFGNMPKIEGLSDEQVEAIIAYVRAQQQEAGLY